MNKVKLLSTTLLLSAVSLFGESTQDNNTSRTDSCAQCNTCCSTPCCCKPCDFVPPGPPDTCAYNAPVFFDIECGWDFFLTASFVYAQAKTDFDTYVAIGEDFLLPTDVTSSFEVTFTENFPTFSFDYEPAFKVGLGFAFGCDNWFFYGEYFRYHADVGSGKFTFVPLERSDVAAGVVFLQSGEELVDSTLTGMNFTSKWRLELDMADFSLNRSCYVGRCLTVNTQIGLRACWIDQTYQLNAQGTEVVDPNLVDVTVNETAKYCSWGVGPRVGVDTNWNLCGQFRVEGDASLSVLYTDYDVDTTNVFIRARASNSENITTKIKDNDRCTISPHTSVALGIGWGDYFCCNDWYLDIAAKYELNVLWNETFSSSNAFVAENIYIHGLVLTCRVDF